MIFWYVLFWSGSLNQWLSDVQKSSWDDYWILFLVSCVEKNRKMCDVSRTSMVYAVLSICLIYQLEMFPFLVQILRSNVLFTKRVGSKNGPTSLLRTSSFGIWLLNRVWHVYADMWMQWHPWIFGRRRWTDTADVRWSDGRTGRLLFWGSLLDLENGMIFPSLKIKYVTRLVVSNIFLFSSLPGEMNQFDYFFFNWVGEKPPPSNCDPSC